MNITPEVISAVGITFVVLGVLAIFVVIAAADNERRNTPEKIEERYQLWLKEYQEEKKQEELEKARKISREVNNETCI